MIKKRLVAAAAMATLAPLTLAACGGGGSNGGGEQRSSSSETVDSLTVLDYYTDEPGKSNIGDQLQKCGTSIGVAKVDHQSVPGPTLIQKVLQQASSKSLPDVLMLDNPDIQQIAETGALAPLERLRDQRRRVRARSGVGGDVRRQALRPAARRQHPGDLLQQGRSRQGRGQPPDDLGRAEDHGQEADRGKQYGFAFNATADYEGAWQFLPPMWTNGGDETDLTSPQVAGALQLWKDLVDDGSVSKSVGQLEAVRRQRPVHRRQGRHDAERSVADPGPARRRRSTTAWSRSRSTPPDQTSVAPLGGEAWTVPLTGDEAKMTKAAELVKCMNTDENQMLRAKQGGLVPTKLALAEQFKKEVPSMAGFADAVGHAPAPAPASSARSGPTPPRRSTPACSWC